MIMKPMIINNPSIGISEIPEYLGLEKGDVVFLSSDIKRIAYNDYCRTGIMPDLNNLINAFTDIIGAEGTLILPTYNWGFCHGATFDWKKTKGETGTLGNICLKREDFKRTKHPIYSYVVWGKFKEKLCQTDFISSFGRDSVFGFMDRHHTKHVMIDVNFNRAFTFLHYAEEKVGNLCYRFTKKFTSNYIDEQGRSSVRTYTMYVRNLLMNVYCEMTPFENEMLEKGIANKIIINDVPYIVVPDVHKTMPYMEDDIKNNYSLKLSKYNGLELNFAK